MFSTNLKGPLATLAVTAGLLAVAGPASADVASPRDPVSGMQLTQPSNAAGAIMYNGHAGLGAFFRPEVDDEGLAYINYEPDVYW